MRKLTIIQGDTTKFTVRLKDVDPDYIQKAHFTCATLQIHKELSYLQDDWWEVVFNTDETSNYRVGCFEYDITLELTTGAIFTPVYNNIMEVKFKNNKIC